MNLLLVMLLWAGPQNPQGTPTDPSVENTSEKTSYVLGYNLGRNFKQEDIQLDMDFFMDGLIAAMNDGEQKYSDAEMSNIMRQFQAEIAKRRRDAQGRLLKENLDKANTFLEANKGKEGVITLPSGLQYKVITAGDGPSPTIDDQVKVHYEGKVAEGNKFDSSYDKGEPITMAVKGFIPGWIEGLQLMKKGAKWEMYIPPNLGYGTAGGGPAIPPNSALVFTVELLDIVGDNPPANK